VQWLLSIAVLGALRLGTAAELLDCGGCCWVLVEA
jgi:hypothetical protein